MAKTITAEEFVALLQKAQYAILNGVEGIYKIDDGYTTRDYPASAWALVNIEDDSDVIVLAEYLDSPDVYIEYNKLFGIPTFTLGGDIRGETIDLTLLTPIKL